MDRPAAMTDGNKKKKDERHPELGVDRSFDYVECPWGFKKVGNEKFENAPTEEKSPPREIDTVAKFSGMHFWDLCNYETAWYWGEYEE